MDASAEFQVFLSPTSKWRDRTQGIRQRLVPVITNMVPSNGFSLNHRSPNIYKAISGVSFQDTDIRGRKKKSNKKEQLGEKKSESEPSIFRSKKEQFTISQLYKKKDSTTESDHKRSNSTKRKPSFEFRHKDLMTIPINPNMEPNKIARTSSKKERSRSSSQIRNPLPLGDRTNSFEFPIRPRRSRSSSRSRNSTGQVGNFFNENESKKNKKKNNSNNRQYCSSTPWKNIDVIRNVEDLRIHKDISDKCNNKPNEEDHNFISKITNEMVTTEVTEPEPQVVTVPSSDSTIQLQQDEEAQDFSNNDLLLYDNIRFDQFEECFEAESSSEVIYVSQTVEVELVPPVVNIENDRMFTSTPVISQENDEDYYDYIDLPIHVSDNPKHGRQSMENNEKDHSQILNLPIDSNCPFYEEERDRVMTNHNEVSVINITSPENNVQTVKPQNMNNVPTEIGQHSVLVNKLSSTSVLSKDSSDYDYVHDFQVNLDLSEDDDEDVSIYSTYIPNSEIESTLNLELKPILPRAHLSHNGEQSMRLRVNGQFVDVSKPPSDNQRNEQNRLLPLNPILRLSDHKTVSINNEENNTRRHSWLNSFDLKNQFEKDQKNEHWSYSHPILSNKSDVCKTANISNGKNRINNDVKLESLAYTESINFDDDDNETGSFPEPLYAPIFIKPKEEIRIPRIPSNGMIPPKTFKGFLQNKCFNPPDSDSEILTSDIEFQDQNNVFCDKAKQNSRFYFNISDEKLNKNRDINNSTECEDDLLSQSWLEASSEFEFVNMRDELDTSSDDAIDTLDTLLPRQDNIFCVKVPLKMPIKKTQESNLKELSTYPTLSSLPAPYSPHQVSSSPSGITL